MKFKDYTGGDLEGTYDVTLKIDGVHVIFENGVAFSRVGNRLPKLESIAAGLNGHYEVYRNDWNTSISLVKNQQLDSKKVVLSDLYRLEAPVDSRLKLNQEVDPTEARIKSLLTDAVLKGYEGLVLKSLDKDLYYKVKPRQTVDLKVLGFDYGKGRNTGRVGAIHTKYGKVGTGLTDKDRIDMAADSDFVGSIIEVEFMHLTKEKRMRHARFKRRRFDKNVEDEL